MNRSSRGVVEDWCLVVLGIIGLFVLYFDNPKIKSLPDFLIGFFACWYLLVSAGIRIFRREDEQKRRNMKEP